MEESQIIEQRKEKVLAFLKDKYHYFAYLFLAFVVWVAVYIRTLPMAINPATGKPGLWDITTNNWTLGPDLDPFLFLRWAKEIVDHGYLPIIDTMRNVPVFFNTAGELKLVSYTTVWVYDVLNWFGKSSIEYAAVIMPVIMFVLTLIAFFLLVRKIFVENVGEKKAVTIASISCFFLAVIPALLPRTIAGIPEKEAIAFFYLFLTFYFFLCAWKAKTAIPRYSFALLSAITTAMMAWAWGGYIYLFVTLGLAVFIAFMLGNAQKEKILVYSTWLVVSIIVMNQLSSRYSLSTILNSSTTLVGVVTLALMLLHLLLFSTRIKDKIAANNRLSKIPAPLVTLGIFIVVGVVAATILFGPSYILDKLTDVSRNFITPIAGRFGVTVAENRQPFYAEWASSFGPSFYEFIQIASANLLKVSAAAQSTLSGIPIFFWLFFFGSVYMFFIMTKSLSFKERAYLTGAYFFFLVCLIFSRYSESSILNGVNAFSLFVYLLGAVIFIGVIGFYYYQGFAKGEQEKFKHFDFGLILLFAFFFLSVVSARGSVRTIMVLVPSAAIMVSYFSVSIVGEAMKTREKTAKLISIIVAALLVFAVIFSGYYFYQASKSTAQQYIPSSYTQQWQKAMGWVRENTPETAVFGHWWDYGYWLQSIGNRATVLDGGNSIVYWDYLMGRYALTDRNDTQAMDFLYAHNTTHFLIDSTDIGKYGAFSSIGSDVNYDRRSWISTFLRDDKQSKENKNSTVYIYSGGIPLDGDLSYDVNGTTRFLPEGSAAILGVKVEISKTGELVSQPEGIFYYQSLQIPLPLKYFYYHHKLYTYATGVEAGGFVLSRIVQAAQGAQLQKDGAMLYLSNKTVLSQVARLYLYQENNSYYKLVHSEDDFYVAYLKSQGYDEDFVLANELRGPIRIWEIQYPQGQELKPEYLLTDYPDKRLSQA